MSALHTMVHGNGIGEKPPPPNAKVQLEIIVVDGGSTDGTAELAERLGARVLRVATPHRARQMNLGAQAARGDVLLFLHADTWLSTANLERLAGAMADAHVAGGGFYRRFRGGGPLLRLSCLLADARSRLLGWHFGDQAIFARRAAFESIGGYRDLPVFEDLDLCRRLKRVGRVVTLGPTIESSARRFQKRGALRVTLHDAWLTLRYLGGADPIRLVTSSSKNSSSEKRLPTNHTNPMDNRRRPDGAG